jgi:hypothetical protein
MYNTPIRTPKLNVNAMYNMHAKVNSVPPAALLSTRSFETFYLQQQPL